MKVWRGAPYFNLKNQGQKRDSQGVPGTSRMHLTPYDLWAISVIMKDILDKREKRVKEGKTTFVDWETAKKRIAAYFLTTGKSNWILYRATVKVRANASPTEEPYAGKPHVRV
ncbi:MAG: hypothetical protein B6240_10715 [Desulfobacteraceae bacterium 4572_87]|nr:MAG: hypothetical protein B6240_10715 [Desulfobacteraceae bacterium 4572_87]